MLASFMRRLAGVIGELLITAGVLVLLFLAWQFFFQDAQIAGQQASEGQDLARQLIEDGAGDDASEPVERGDVPVGTQVGDHQNVGVLYVPRMADDFVRPIVEGVDKDALDHLGAGHYPYSQQVGDVGNFAVASHRSGWGSNFRKIHKLRLGDEIIVQTKDGWYTYRYRNTAYVMETQISVIDPVPDEDSVQADARLITLTSCNPYPFSQGERIIAYGVFESFTPIDEDPPAAVQKILEER